MAGPDIHYWQQRFEQRQTPWDRGAPSPMLGTWLDAGAVPADGAIIVPGCGSGHEVALLASHGHAVIGIDYAAAAIGLARERLNAHGLSAHLVEADVLAWQPAEPAAAVYEQTCLCALHPDRWVDYAGQLHRWLRPGGALLALFMQIRRDGAAEGRIEGPPYHGDINAMRALFPATHWDWPAPPYERVPHPAGWFELALILRRH
jgi:SAM-dependent methyltransferase